MNLSTKWKQSHRCRKLMVTGGKGGKGKLGDWD